MSRALGNALDRVLRSYVVDYLDFHWCGWHWPAFNLADVSITLGARALVIASLRHSPKPSFHSVSATESASPPNERK